MANQDSNGRFTAGNTAAKGRGKKRFTEKFQAIMDKHEAVEKITEDLIGEYFKEGTTTKDKVAIATYLLNKVVISAEKDAELAVEEQKTADIQAMQEKLNGLINLSEESQVQ